MSGTRPPPPPASIVPTGASAPPPTGASAAGASSSSPQAPSERRSARKPVEYSRFMRRILPALPGGEAVRQEAVAPLDPDPEVELLAFEAKVARNPQERRAVGEKDVPCSHTDLGR